MVSLASVNLKVGREGDEEGAGRRVGAVRSRPEPLIEHLVKGRGPALRAQVQAIHLCGQKEGAWIHP